ncbi:50S ribosomal protein L28 [Candidatus Johnevansia muelleri]|uniref:Large ribosomal subunit protein bL28 n=1 Tax=Candidatus Johnevansia muelleri TaxID=1495769 RepID=A0A078KBN9_9GAMM|nr:50S ribosomal protein L28 [Candidatus Evansia muelleri]
MKNICKITGKKKIVGNNVSHSNKKTKKNFFINLQNYKFYLEKEKYLLKLRISCKGKRFIYKNGIYKYFKKIFYK